MNKLFSVRNYSNNKRGNNDYFKSVMYTSLARFSGVAAAIAAAAAKL